MKLAFERIDGVEPAQAIAFLHGILGQGSNLQNIATLRSMHDEPNNYGTLKLPRAGGTTARSLGRSICGIQS